MKPSAIDPFGCGCTECMTGEYIPLERATAKQLRKMLKGKLDDHTSERFSKTVITDYYTRTTVITAEYSGRTWHWEKALE